MNNRNKHSDPDSELYRAILRLKTLEECYDFFTDLCTAGELKAMEQRFEVASCSMKGSSTTTFWRRPVRRARRSAA